MHLDGKQLITKDAPCGIISFELAGSVAQAEEILESWNKDTRLHAAFNLGYDFLFIPVYVCTIALGCGIVSNTLRKRKRSLSSLGSLLAWGVILAGSLDVIENIALVKILYGSVASPWPEIAQWCAISKFGLVIFGLVFIIYGSIVYITASKKSNTE